jgi:hypothetical protein
MIAPLSFVAGALTWSASEYAIHRFIGHGAKRAPATGWSQLTPQGFAAGFNEEHLAHHTDPMYFAPAKKKAIAAVVATSALTAVGSVVLGPRRAASYALGFTTMYLTYEFLHRRIHTHPPRTRYGRWLRRHHLFHHYKSPRNNHGVTSPLWDHVFRTHLDPAEKVRVSRRTAPAWMVDERGELRPEYAADYELVGRVVSASAPVHA